MKQVQISAKLINKVLCALALLIGGFWPFSNLTLAKTPISEPILEVDCKQIPKIVGEKPAEEAMDHLLAIKLFLSAAIKLLQPDESLLTLTIQILAQELVSFTDKIACQKYKDDPLPIWQTIDIQKLNKIKEEAQKLAQLALELKENPSFVGNSNCTKNHPSSPTQALDCQMQQLTQNSCQQCHSSEAPPDSATFVELGALEEVTALRASQDLGMPPSWSTIVNSWSWDKIHRQCKLEVRKNPEVMSCASSRLRKFYEDLGDERNLAIPKKADEVDIIKEEKRLEEAAIDYYCRRKTAITISLSYLFTSISVWTDPRQDPEVSLKILNEQMETPNFRVATLLMRKASGDLDSNCLWSVKADPDAYFRSEYPDIIDYSWDVKNAILDLHLASFDTTPLKSRRLVERANGLLTVCQFCHESN